MAVQRTPVLPVPLATAIAFSLFSAAANVWLLAGSGGGRVRDLRIMRLLRRAADQLDWNILARVPSWVHTERDLTSGAEWALFFICAAIACFFVLFPLAILFRRLALVNTRGSSTAILISLLSPPAFALAAGGVLSPAVTAAVIVLVAVMVFGAASRVSEGSLNRLLSWAALTGILVAAVALAAAPFAIRKREVEQSAAREGTPNIVLISIDSLRADHLHSYGYPRNTSPNIDTLATEGAAFETVISPTSWTLPAHMTLMTSLPPEEHGVITNHLRLARGIDTLPQRLQRSGYATGGFVSATYLDGLYGFSRGFDDYDDYTLLRVAGEKSRAAVTSHRIAQRAIGWLQQRAAARQRPFFLFLHFFDVHYDYNPPPPYARMFDADYAGRATGNVDSVHQGMPRRDLNHVVALYDGEIAWVDANIGKILNALHTLGFDNNTIVAITADHGEEFLEHGQAAHYKTLYDEVLRVPLLIRYPGHVAPGRRLHNQVRLMDVAPTLLTLAGFQVARHRAGTEARSLACMLTSPAPPLHAPVLPAFGDLRGEVASVRTDDAKLIRNLRTNKEEFYNLDRDPGERRNIDAVEPRERDQLRLILNRWRSSATSASSGEANLDDEEKASLRSLGYLQ